MKILQILPALEQGGVERGTIEIACALTKAGVPNGVVSSGGRMVQELEKLGVPHYRLPVNSKNPFTILRNATTIAKIAAENGYTLMHVRSRAPAWSVRRASKLCGVPWMATFHGVYGTSPRFLKIPYNRVMLGGLKTICVSNYVMKHVLETYRPDPSMLVRIHRGADTDYFRADAVTFEEAMEKKTLHYEIPADYPVVLLPGRLTSWKGQEVLLEAAKLMKHKRIAIVFLGSDQGRTDYSDRLRTLAGKLPCETRVVFRPSTTEMAKVYRMSDIVVSASSAQPEAFGRVIPEAQAMGRLVLATAHGGACETIEDGKTGFLVPPGDAAAMAAALDRILDLSEEEKNRIASAAVESVQANFSTRKMCERTLDVYRELARLRRNGAGGRREVAILMAAGLGSRMKPLTDTTAKPFVRVRGRPLVETVIDALNARGVDDIYVVVGYKKEQFEVLPKRYPNVHLIANDEYATKNNINSIAVAAEQMASADCFVCEADLFIPSDRFLCRPLERSGYFGKFVPGHSDDWVFGTEGGRITRVGKGGDDCFNMVGVSYFRQPDAARIAAAVLEAVKKPENAQLFWDDIVDRLCRQGLDLVVHEVQSGEIVECDTVQDLENLEKSLSVRNT